MKTILMTIVYAILFLAFTACEKETDFTCNCIINGEVTQHIYLDFEQVDAAMACAENEAQARLIDANAHCTLEVLE